MLNEKLCKISVIADVSGLYFVWRRLCDGVTSIDALKKFRLSYPGKITADVSAVILLLDSMDCIECVGPDEVTILDHQLMSDDRKFIDSFSEKYIKFLIEENVIDFSCITYDSDCDSFVLPHYSIARKNACYRNLLISLEVLSKREDGNYFIDRYLDYFVQINSTYIRKKSEEQLLKEIEEQRVLGELGEKYVLDFENRRLRDRNDLHKVKRISVIDVSAGFDIVSFESVESCFLDRFIEVKTYKGKPHFYWSKNEMDTARIRGNSYYLYLVDGSKIKEADYIPYVIRNPIHFFNESTEWNSAPESFLFTKLI